MTLPAQCNWQNGRGTRARAVALTAVYRQGKGYSYLPSAPEITGAKSRIYIKKTLYGYASGAGAVAAADSTAAGTKAQDAVIKTFLAGLGMLIGGFGLVMIAPAVGASWLTDAGLIATAAGGLVASGASERYRSGR